LGIHGHEFYTKAVRVQAMGAVSALRVFPLGEKARRWHQRKSVTTLRPSMLRPLEGHHSGANLQMPGKVVVGLG
jgi:hypothetical protein